MFNGGLAGFNFLLLERRFVGFSVRVTNQGIGLRRTDTEPPCYKGNECRTRSFGFPTGLGPDGPREIHSVTL